MISIRQIIGVLLALAAIIFLIQTIRPAAMYISRGGPVGETLLDPIYLLRFIGGGLGLVGGLLAALKKPGGVWAALIGSILLIIPVVLMIVGDLDQMLWMQIAVYAVPMLILALGLAFTKRAQSV